MNSQYYNLPRMQEILIYDIESSVCSEENVQQPRNLMLNQRKIEKQTQISEVQTRTIKINSNSSEDSPMSKEKIEHPFTEDIIFYDDELRRSTKSIEFDDTKRGFLKREQDSQQSEGDLEQEYEDQVAEMEDMHPPAINRRAIVPEQRVLQDRSVLIRAHRELLVKQLVPYGYKLSCKLQIDRNFVGLAIRYRLSMAQTEQFLLSAKKEIFKLASNFIISRNPSEIHRRDSSYLGRLQANFIGTEFKLYTVRQQFENLKMVVTYEKNIAGFGGVRKLKVVKPGFKTKEGISNSLANIMERNQKSKLIEMNSAQPVLRSGKYRLDFGKKVKVPSAKNFILETVDEKEKVKKNCLLFCKIAEDAFLMQICYPLTIFQAFGICLSSLDSKLMVN